MLLHNIFIPLQISRAKTSMCVIFTFQSLQIIFTEIVSVSNEIIIFLTVFLDV